MQRRSGIFLHPTSLPSRYGIGDLGTIPLIAEDLDMITGEVNALRKSIGIPGMRVLQFAFDGGEDNPHLPHNITKDSIIYTGTHDNDTTAGWLEKISKKDTRL